MYNNIVRTFHEWFIVAPVGKYRPAPRAAVAAVISDGGNDNNTIRAGACFCVQIHTDVVVVIVRGQGFGVNNAQWLYTYNNGFNASFGFRRCVCVRVMIFADVKCTHACRRRRRPECTSPLIGRHRAIIVIKIVIYRRGCPMISRLKVIFISSHARA